MARPLEIEEFGLCVTTKLEPTRDSSGQESHGRPQCPWDSASGAELLRQLMCPLGRPSAQVDHSAEGICDDLAQECPKDLRQSSLKGANV